MSTNMNPPPPPPPSGTSEGKGPSAGGGFSSKIKGATQVAYGLGETIRGTTLSTFDSMTHASAGESKNEDVAAKGRQEIAEGMGKIRGQGQQATPTHGATGAGAVPAGAGAGQVAAATQMQGTAGQATAAEKSERAQGEAVGQAGAAQRTTGAEGAVQGAERKEEEARQEAQRRPSGRKEGLIGEGADAPGGPGTCIY
ncbi:hypothetical protein F5I97DRAFT_1119503 [Phlebopus sp. FC_14]|nr:hypothetical protein F5I97DRAFT_1119503 [Phlebopus sp. FC_14]